MDGANSAAVRVANIKIGIHESLPVIAELSACIERKAPCPTLERTIHAGGVLMGAISMPYNAIERNCARQDVSEYHVHVCLTHDIPRLGVDAGYDHYDDEMLSILTKNPDDGENAWRTFIYPSFTHTNVAYAYSDGYLIIAELVGVKK
ncbi:hypothetical protein [Insolitispirillum peregrinum]|nr:hypothetical protein [Insolitispirillum peregrinum]